uniref:uncharacterized protein LOC100180449 n=1 Tax=Ciona intestinalis TaxID=7719 RepID=UPI000180C68B|nr:uncharacterized protein LOC100180449 [Ciona intestinalis]|eukprot:XP_002131251.1 uncharacterized protein LOC100180449 [Ciona intestinalis]
MENYYVPNASRQYLRNDDALISGLPKQFVNSMKTLFNILDDTGVGLVPLTEIERRWRDDAVPNLPGVLDCLRSVAPVDGLLSFEVFVWGLRTALSRARKSREKNKFKDSTNTKPTTKQESENDILPPYYYRDIGKGKVPRYNSNTNSDNEGLRSGSYVTQSSRWMERNDVTFGRYPLNAYSGENNFNSHNENRTFKSGHRRSNSGPISTAKVLPSPKRTQWPNSNRDEVRVTKMGYATKFAAETSHTEDEKLKNKLPHINTSLEEIKSDTSADKSFLSLKSDSSICSLEMKKGLKSDDEFSVKITQDSSSEKSFHCSEKSELDRVTANTLFINSDDKNSMNKMKPIGLSGKYIGITGTMQRAKSSACITNGYGSLRRPTTTAQPGGVTSASESCFRVETIDRRKREGSRMSKKTNPFPTQRRQYASAGESGDESHMRISDMISTINSDRKRAASVIPNRKKMQEDDQVLRDGSGRRCNSASPPDRPATKTARNSSSINSPKQSNAEENSPEQDAAENVQKDSAGVTSVGVYATVGRRRGSKKREARRHTVANGIDYNVLKLIQQLEQEKDVLLQGLDALERGRDWFQERISDVQEKQRLLSNNGMKPTRDVTENDATVTQSRIDNLLTKVSEMSKLVQAMNETDSVPLDAGESPDSTKNARVITALREQNHVLTRDVTKKSDKISQLEHEKSVLVQQLFQAKAEAQCVDGQVNTSIFI